MPRQQLCSRPERFSDIATATRTTLLDFLVPTLSHCSRHRRSHAAAEDSGGLEEVRDGHDVYGDYFLGALSSIGRCAFHATAISERKSRRRLRSSVAGGPSRTKRDVHSSNLPRLSRDIQRRRLSTTATQRHPTNAQAAHGETTGNETSDSFREIFHSKARRMASQSHLPKDFFNDVFDLQLKVTDLVPEPVAPPPTSEEAVEENIRKTFERLNDVDSDMETQIRLLRSVRELEERLLDAKAALNNAMKKRSSPGAPSTTSGLRSKPRNATSPAILSKEDYKGLVDLYYYSQRNRFSPSGADYSPSLTFLDGHQIEVPEMFRGRSRESQDAAEHVDSVNEEDLYESPLKDIEKVLLRNQNREVNIMQAFIDLLLDEKTSNRDLYYVYKQFPQPGVAWLPKGVQRLFLQRMATPWTRTRLGMVRYLSLIDDMQEAKQPITSGEWSSAIYLAGRSFSSVTETQVDSAILFWRKMEQDAGAKSTHVTFNILFDIAIRAGKFTLAESFLKEMYARNLRLNRLGRVSMIYYHGLRGDGDAVRRTYRDFVDAGETVDTLVLNCVITALLNAQEPTAAEQVFERMRDLQKRIRSGKRADGSDTFYLRYPDATSSTIDREMGSNALGRVLLGAHHLKKTMADHHADLQTIMPLRPDHVTFRSMMSYHANVSGDLDRITVLLKQMTEEYNLPLRPAHYQLLFKGFALHGKPKTKHAKWSFQRLEMAWDACRNDLQAAKAARQAARSAATHQPDEEEPTLPKLAEAEAMIETMNQSDDVATPRQQKSSAWENLKHMMSGSSEEQLIPIERVHSHLFDGGPAQARPVMFSNPFFPTQDGPSSNPRNQTYPLGDNIHIDHEEGEYTLPLPKRTITHVRLQESETSDFDAANNHPRVAGNATDQDHGASARPGENHDDEPPDDYAHYVASLGFSMNKPMVCWLLRAYTQCTGSRAKVEEIWNSVRKWYRPGDEADTRAVVRVLERCLRDCDRYGDYIL